MKPKKNALEEVLIGQDQKRTLYHYTSVGGFLAICESRSLRASDLKALNDPREVSLGSDLLENYLAELGYPKPGTQQDHLSRLREQYSELRDDFALFGVSLSRSRDSLPQWLEYGDRGRGICIGFKEYPFDREKLGFVEALEVAYSQAEFLNSIQDTFLESEKAWIEHSESADDAANNGHIFSSSLKLLASCAAYKHHTWAHEQEVRFIATSYRFGKTHQTEYSLTDAGEQALGEGWPKFRERAGHIIPYIDLPLGEEVAVKVGENDVDAIFVLDEVIVGPICPADMNAVGAVLNRGSKHLYCLAISRSECNIRP